MQTLKIKTLVTRIAYTPHKSTPVINIIIPKGIAIIMATADTVNLGPPHPPKEESIKAFAEVEADLKKQLLHLKHTYLSNSLPTSSLSILFLNTPCLTIPPEHEPEYFAPVQHLSDHDLTSFSTSDLESVRVAQSAYGIHILGKIRILAMPDTGPAYLHVRVFVSDDPAKLHSIHTEEREEPGGGKKFRAVFTKDDPLEWFDT
ncbi:hypothetical protein HD806DRAFT_184924 [Xylariaceae sp. AK1471]|nr:hypothetical protein HD806DRAFT_184924 [Xylariaceae sp. AK1471]